MTTNHSIINLPCNHHFTDLIIISFMYIPLPPHNNFIVILLVGIPNDPLRIIISDTRETLHTRCHISINGSAHTSCQSRHSYTVLLTQAVK
ncbi:Nuclear cap-binding subunit 1-A [Gossypium arboreum]|uniref:Nuclear cap-binding subunit 1-A n=1 Tax=Gossypium arboreum TaxID=29729 RepID=A0A0B0MX50_GOSAR|nr:Nuclear cap-binding subunit 1-A [Gossypium arboreum]